MCVFQAKKGNCYFLSHNDFISTRTKFLWQDDQVRLRVWVITFFILYSMAETNFCTKALVYSLFRDFLKKYGKCRQMQRPSSCVLVHFYTKQVKITAHLIQKSGIGPTKFSLTNTLGKMIHQCFLDNWGFSFAFLWRSGDWKRKSSESKVFLHDPKYICTFPLDQH